MTNLVDIITLPSFNYKPRLREWNLSASSGKTNSVVLNQLNYSGREQKWHMNQNRGRTLLGDITQKQFLKNMTNYIKHSGLVIFSVPMSLVKKIVLILF